MTEAVLVRLVSLDSDASVALVEDEMADVRKPVG